MRSSSKATLVALGCTVAVTWAMYDQGFGILPTVVVGMIVMALVSRLWRAVEGPGDGHN
ncbi:MULTISPECIES: hypothetical protein [unclassified Luteococcus]|uniref:hypothetical protein n=1 Tax=unclassified Luteococcus TaxID=2639923 RepID=UPI00313A990F